MDDKMLIAAEACLEQDPSPIHEAWFERIFAQKCTTFVPPQPQKVACTTRVPRTKHNKI